LLVKLYEFNINNNPISWPEDLSEDSEPRQLVNYCRDQEPSPDRKSTPPAPKPTRKTKWDDSYIS